MLHQHPNTKSRLCQQTDTASIIIQTTKPSPFILHNFLQGHLHKVALLDVRMGKRKFGRFDMYIVIHEQVNVDGTVVELSIYRFLIAPQ